MPIIGLITEELILHKNSLLLMEVLMSILKRSKAGAAVITYKPGASYHQFCHCRIFFVSS
jgi:hypothetical protein